MATLMEENSLKISEILLAKSAQFRENSDVNSQLRATAFEEAAVLAESAENEAEGLPIKLQISRDGILDILSKHAEQTTGRPVYSARIRARSTDPKDIFFECTFVEQEQNFISSPEKAAAEKLSAPQELGPSAPNLDNGCAQPVTLSRGQTIVLDGIRSLGDTAYGTNIVQAVESRYKVGVHYPSVVSAIEDLIALKLVEAYRKPGDPHQYYRATLRAT